MTLDLATHFRKSLHFSVNTVHIDFYVVYFEFYQPIESFECARVRIQFVCNYLVCNRFSVCFLCICSIRIVFILRIDVRLNLSATKHSSAFAPKCTLYSFWIYILYWSAYSFKNDLNHKFRIVILLSSNRVSYSPRSIWVFFTLIGFWISLCNVFRWLSFKLLFRFSWCWMGIG